MEGTTQHLFGSLPELRNIGVEMSSYNARIRELISLAEAQGWDYRQANNGHHNFILPSGRIIAASLTPSDGNAIHAVERDLKDAGLKIPDDRELLMNKRRVRGIREAVRDYLRLKAPAPLTSDDVFIYVHAKIPGATKQSVHAALSGLHNSGLAVKVDRGQYRWGESLPDIPAPAPAPTPVEPQIDLQELSEGDSDERILDEALAALSKIESVVRKHRAIAKHLRDLPKMLGLKV